jgi:hypothetical protein
LVHSCLGPPLEFHFYPLRYDRGKFFEFNCISQLFMSFRVSGSSEFCENNTYDKQWREIPKVKVTRIVS